MPKRAYSSNLLYWQLYHKTVILRADLNVPIHNGTIMDETKLTELQPTLDYLIEKQSTIVILTHIGRPICTDIHLSTQLLIPWFTKHNYPVIFTKTPSEAQTKIHNTLSPVLILLENLRFFQEEQSHSITFAQELKKLGEFYVHEGFSVMHSKDTSTAILPKLFDTSHRTIGFAAAKELNTLNTLVHSIQKPCIVILGGAKLNTKIEYIRDFLNIADTVIICPALAFTFLKAQGLNVGRSLVDSSCIQSARKILSEAKKRNLKLILPLDVTVEYAQSQYIAVQTNKIPHESRGISVGPKTIEHIDSFIKGAHTIIYNGTIGFLEYPESLIGMKEILTKIGTSGAQTLVVGGDTTAAVHKLDMASAFTYLSSGGGAVLAYIIHKTLPAL